MKNASDTKKLFITPEALIKKLQWYAREQKKKEIQIQNASYYFTHLLPETHASYEGEISSLAVEHQM